MTKYKKKKEEALGDELEAHNFPSKVDIMSRCSDACSDV